MYTTYATQNSIIESSWAVITGGSDGIGLEMSRKLAKEGFNICIISRNLQKINEKIEEIKKDCRPGDESFKTMAIQADFWKMRTIEEYQKIVADKLQDLDVAVLILNAGYATGGPFIKIDGHEIEKVMQINCNHVLYTAKVMLGQLSKRKETKGKKSACIVTASIAANVPLSGMTVYCASKTFASYVAEGLNYELKDTVDIVSYKPAQVATKMVKESMRDWSLITSETAVDTCFRDVGLCQKTNGALKHQIASWMMTCFPTSMLQGGVYKKITEYFEKNGAPAH